MITPRDGSVHCSHVLRIPQGKLDIHESSVVPAAAISCGLNSPDLYAHRDCRNGTGGAHCFNLVKLAINDRTHVVPPSFEYDSSYWCESGLMSDHTALTRIVLSFTVLS